MATTFRALALFLLALLIAGVSAWGALALTYAASAPVLAAVQGAVGVIAAIAVFFRRSRRAALAVVALDFALLFGWWSTVEPSNDRDWKPEVAVLPYATIDGDLVTMHNIRNFDYRTTEDFTPAYYDKTFDLRTLDTVDLIASYWMGPAIAHLLISFGFGGKDYLAVSIETRTERGEGYSTLAGFFRQYELFYVVADERDVIRVRTNYRKDPPEEVHLYRTHGSLENARRLFLDYVREINSLKEQPEFYNTATTNCTTNIFMHTRVNPTHLRFSWKLLLSGYTPEYAYEGGRLDTSVPFEELKRRSIINSAAQAADDAPDFSVRIRKDSLR